MNNRLINTKAAGGGGGCTDIVDNYDPFGGNGVALYQLNGNADDESPNAYNASWVGTPSYSTGVFGQSAVFNGSTSRIDTPLTSLTDSYTISMWINASAFPSGAFAQISGFKEPNSYAAWLGIYPNGLVAFTPSDGGGSVSSPAGAVSLNTWYHLVGVKDGTTGYFYINGQSQGSTTTTTTTVGSQNLNLGRYDVETIFTFTGSIDQVRIFNEALTPLEVEALYTEELCICDGTVDTLQVLGDTSCIATYQLDGNANDLSGNYSGTPTDVSYGVGEFDLAGVFNGSSSSIVLPTAVIPADNFTISFWINSNDVTPQENIITQYVFASGSNGRFVSYIQNGYFIVAVESNGSGTNFNYVLSDNTWYHIALIKNGTWECFIDGNSVGTWSDTVNITTSYNTQIGSRVGSSDYFTGKLDQVRIFNKALDQNEVDTLYAESACTYGGRQSEGTQILGDTSCIAYYKLDGTADDETGTYNGTFTTPNYGNGEFLYSAVFNGSTSGINTTYTPTVANLRTVSFWFKAGEQPSYRILYTVGGYGVSNNYSWASCYLNLNGTISGGYAANNGGSVYIITTNGTYDDNLWHNVVLVYNGVYGTGSSVDMYVDNELINTTPDTAFNTSISAVTGTFRLGHYFQNGNYTKVLDGSIDQVRVFDRELTSGEVTTLYNEGI